MDAETENKQARMAILKERATQMGIKFWPSISESRLADLIEKASNDEDVSDGEDASDDEEMSKGVESSKGADRLLAPRIRVNTKLDAIAAANKLIRCKITCNNPNKVQWRGEIFTAGNAVMPPIKKFIAFGVPYHVPQIILNMIRERMMQVFYTERTERGEVKRTRLAPEFTIDILPPLTQAEFDGIKTRQLARGKTEEDANAG
jgi:hypothetical protein